MVLRIVSHKVFSHLPRDLVHVADSNGIPWNQPTIFHPILIATLQQMFLLLLFVLLFPQFHSYRIDELLMFDESMIDLHRICQIPKNCQCKWLSAFQTARETFVNSFPSPEKCLFCTGTTVFFEWLNLLPRQSIDDFVEIHILR